MPCDTIFCFTISRIHIVNGFQEVPDVISLNESGFNISHFDEYAHDISGMGEFLSTKENRPPMCFSLIANKVGGK